MDDRNSKENLNLKSLGIIIESYTSRLFNQKIDSKRLTKAERDQFDSIIKQLTSVKADLFLLTLALARRFEENLRRKNLRETKAEKLKKNLK